MDESKEELVDSVCRYVVEPLPEEQQDTVMEDCSQAQKIQADGNNAYRPVDSSMDYGTVGNYNSRDWTHDDGCFEPSSGSGWSTSEATVYSSW